jgi:preprotein translocase SecE subunit
MGLNDDKERSVSAATMPEPQQPQEPSRRRAAAPKPRAPQRPGGGSPLRLYKPGQGVYVRWGTAAGAGVLAVGCANFLYDQLALVNNLWVQTLVPVAVLVFLGVMIFRMIGQKRAVVEFMIATEGELRKVSWPSNKEVLGATRVVIVCVLALSFLLFLVDMVSIVVFSLINLLRIDVLGRLFSAGGNT